MVKNPSVIKNKVKRTAMYAKYKQQKKKLKKKLREERVAEVEALGEAAPPKQVPKTIENCRELDETLVQPDDEEIAGDEKDDEFAKYFTNETKPKIMITTRPKCSRKLFPFIGDLMQMIPNAFYYPRGTAFVPNWYSCNAYIIMHFFFLTVQASTWLRTWLSMPPTRNSHIWLFLLRSKKSAMGTLLLLLVYSSARHLTPHFFHCRLLITHLPNGPTAFLKVILHSIECLHVMIACFTRYVCVHNVLLTVEQLQGRREDPRPRQTHEPHPRDYIEQLCDSPGSQNWSLLGLSLPSCTSLCRAFYLTSRRVKAGCVVSPCEFLPSFCCHSTGAPV